MRPRPLEYIQFLKGGPLDSLILPVHRGSAANAGIIYHPSGNPITGAEFVSFPQAENDGVPQHFNYCWGLNEEQGAVVTKGDVNDLAGVVSEVHSYQYTESRQDGEGKLEVHCYEYIGRRLIEDVIAEEKEGLAERGMDPEELVRASLKKNG